MTDAGYTRNWVDPQYVADLILHRIEEIVGKLRPDQRVQVMVALVDELREFRCQTLAEDY